MPGIVPKLSETPGAVDWTGPELGEHNEEVYKNILGYNNREYEELKEKGVI